MYQLIRSMQLSCLVGYDVLPTHEDGRGTVIRTPDPLLPKQVLYQAELYPEIFEAPQCPTLRSGSSADRAIR